MQGNRSFKLVTPSAEKIRDALTRGGYMYLDSMTQLSEELEKEAHVPAVMREVITESVASFYAARGCQRSDAQTKLVHETSTNVFNIVFKISSKL